MSTISVPEHLWETLIPLTKLDGMPLELLELLQQHIKPRIEDSSHEIPYDLIVRISKWCQSEEGVKKLEGADLGKIYVPTRTPLRLKDSRSQVLLAHTATSWHHLRPIFETTSAPRTPEGRLGGQEGNYCIN
jgi:hypothetical protein